METDLYVALGRRRKLRGFTGEGKHTRDFKWPRVLRRQQGHLYATRRVMNLINLAREKDCAPFTDADHVFAPLRMNLLCYQLCLLGTEAADSEQPLFVRDSAGIHSFICNH